MARLAPKYLIPQFMLAHFSHHVATGVLVPLLPILRQSFGLTYFQSGLLVSSFSLAYGLGQVPLAMLADRFSRRLIIVLGLILISFTGMGVSFTRDFWQMAAFFVAMGLIGGTYHAPASSFISQSMPANIRGRALGLHVTGGSSSFLVTPAMALGLATLFQTWRAAFLLLALPALVVGILLWLTTEETRGDVDRAVSVPEDPEAADPDPVEAPTVSWTQILKALGLVVLLSMTMQIVFSSINAYLPLYLVDRYGISPKWAGLVISLIAGAGIVGAPMGGMLSDRFGRKRVILACFALAGPLLFAVTWAPYGPLLLLALVVMGLTMSVRMPTMESLIADVVPVGRRTTVLGVYFFLGTETAGVTTPLIGGFIDRFGLGLALNLLAGGLSVLAAVALLFRKRF